MVGPMCTMVLSLPIVEPTKSPTTDRSKREPPGQWTSCLGQNTLWLGLLNLLNETKISLSLFSDGSNPRATTWLTKRGLTLIGRCQLSTPLFLFFFACRHKQPNLFAGKTLWDCCNTNFSCPSVTTSTGQGHNELRWQFIRFRITTWNYWSVKGWGGER